MCPAFPRLARTRYARRPERVSTLERELGRSQSFVMLKPKAPGRRAVVRTIHQNTGIKPKSPVLVPGEDQLLECVSRRLQKTLISTLYSRTIYRGFNIDQALLAGGANAQLTNGSASYSDRGWTGQHASHIPLTTFSAGKLPLAHQGLAELDDLLGIIDHRRRRKTFPASCQILADAIALSADVEFLPAFMNLSMGKAIEPSVSRLSKGIPILSEPRDSINPKRDNAIIIASMFNLFEKDQAFILPIQDRLTKIKKGEASPINQNPDDETNLFYGGKEETFLEHLLAIIESGDHLAGIEDSMADIDYLAGYFAEKREVIQSETDRGEEEFDGLDLEWSKKI